MKVQSFPRLLASRWARACAIVFLCAIAATSTSAQGPSSGQQFSSDLERQLWKTLPPMGAEIALPGPKFVPLPQRVSNNTPSSVSKVFAYVDDYGQTVYKSTTPTNPDPAIASAAYITERDLLMADVAVNPALHDGECTFSHVGDDQDGQWHQCKLGTAMVPPVPGALLNPVGIAVDGATVYVVDSVNHRVQAFDFDGRVKPMQFPIGNGIPGIGAYSYPGYFPYASFTGSGFESVGNSGEMLNTPNGIAVDAAHNILVADSQNHRIAVFAPTGQLQASFSIDPHPAAPGTPFQPTLVAITPGATAGVLNPARPNDRIVVTDWWHCMVRIYNTDFSETESTLPATAPVGNRNMHDFCLAPGDPLDENVIFTSGPGEFSTVTGATIDQAGHIYITDHAQSVVQVLDGSGGTIGWIGKPGATSDSREDLNGPVGVTFDHLGRVGVIDGGNSRVAFYTLDYDPDTGDLSSTNFEFQLDVTVSVQDFPMGIAEQIGTGPGLDSKGRFLATDPFNRRVLRFELPELGIADPAAPFFGTGDTLPSGLIVPPGFVAGHGSFKVAVPKQKNQPVHDVQVSVVPVESGVAVVAGSLKPVNPSLVGTTINIAPADYVEYQFYYLAPESAKKATFKIDAFGDFNGTTYLANAPQGEAKSRAACGSLCDATAQVVWLQPENHGNTTIATPMTNPTTGTWYGDRVQVRIFPQPIDADVVGFGWYYNGQMAISSNEHDAEQETLIPPGDNHIDVFVGAEGASRVYYWAIASDGGIGPTHFIDLKLDLTVPDGQFVQWPAYTGGPDPDGRSWYNHPVTVKWNVTDALSGTDADINASTATPDGSQAINTDGRDQYVTVDITDRAGHTLPMHSGTGSGGRWVNIDTVAPTFIHVPTAPIQVSVSGSDANGSYGVLDVGRYSLTSADVSDPPLANGAGPGSGVASIVNPTFSQRYYLGVPNQYFEYAVTDYAGNTSRQRVDITVLQANSAVAAPDRQVGYGNSVLLRAAVEPRSATGTISFSFGPYSIPNVPIFTSDGVDPVTGPHNKGEAVVQIPQVLASVAVYPMTVTYSGDQFNNPASGSALVDVTKRAVVITAQAKQKNYGTPDPALTFTVAGLINGDTLTNVTLARAAGEGVGLHPITLATADPGNNYYILQYVPADLTIQGFVTVTAPSVGITYGQATPAFVPQYSAMPEGGVLQSPATCGVTGSPINFGSYPITCANAAGPYLTFSYVPGTYSIAKKPATLIAGSGVKVFGLADPVMTPSSNGILAADLAGITLTTTRAAGENIGDYPTSVTASGGQSANYIFTVVPGNLRINPAGVIINITGGTFTYDGLTHPATCTVTAPNGSLLTGALSYSPGGTAVPLNAGSYTATCSFAGDANYQPASGTATVTINRRPATLTASSGTKLLGAVDPALAPPAQTGILAADLAGITLTTTRTAGETVGSYPTTATATGGKSANYDFTVVPGAFTITTKVQVIPAPVTITYGDPAPTFSFTYGPFPAGYSQGNVLVPPVCGVAGNPTGAGTYTITCSGGLINGLITFDYQTATLTINKKAATIVANNATRQYGAVNPAFTATVGGTVNGDTLNYTLATTATTTSPVGSYDITVTPGTNPNYNVTATKGTLSVTARPVTITADAKSAVYGNTIPALTYQLTQGSLVNGDVFSGSLTRTAGFAVGTYPIQQGTVALNSNYALTYVGANLTITPRSVTLTAGNNQKIAGQADPSPLATVTVGGDGFLAADNIVLSATRTAGETVGNYVITPSATGAAIGNYTIASVTTGIFKIISANTAPVAVNDTASVLAGAAVTIPVLTNDTDANGDTLTITSVTQPASGGTVTIVGNQVVFTSFASFAGTATFTYTISDGKGGTATATVTVTVASCVISGFTTYTQGGWGASPNGNNPAMLLQNKFAQVYPGGSVAIGGAKKLTFTSAAAIHAFLPAGGTASTLTASATNPTSSSAGVFAGQVLALQLNVDFSKAGVTKRGLADLVFSGYTVDQILAAANEVIGGNTAVLTQYGMSISDLNALVDSINRNFDNGTTNNGVLSCPAGPVVNHPPTLDLADRSNPKGNILSVTIAGSDPDGNALTYTATGLPTGLTMSTSGVITGTPTTAGSFTVTVTAKDPSNATATDTFVWTITLANRAPVAVSDSATVYKGQSKSIAVKANDSDPDGDALTVTSVTKPSKGSVAIQADGTIKYTTPSSTWTGTTTFSYTISDGKGGTASAVVTVTVTGSHTSGDGCGSHS